MDPQDFHAAVWSLGLTMDDPDVAALVDHWDEVVAISHPTEEDD